MVRKQKEIYALVSLGKHYEIPLAVRQTHSWQVHKTLHFLTFFPIFHKYQRADLQAGRLQQRYRGIHYTDKKENQIFLINKEIQSGAVAKSYSICGRTF